jgi:formylglycine-generating enzyme required for sulfatase activity
MLALLALVSAAALAGCGAAFTRAAVRNRFNPDGISLSIGFRCAA